MIESSKRINPFGSLPNLLLRLHSLGFADLLVYFVGEVDQIL
jgi:hypothetical protein